ncbi:MAG: glycosyltransferase family 4 protein [Cyclobacteriaceae bacterium]
MRILIYQPYNQIVVYIESVAEQFVREGHQVFFVSHDERGETHKNFEEMGCLAEALPVVRSSTLGYYFRRIVKLIQFCKEKQVDVVYSHFQEANIISVFAQFFCQANFVINRHHTDCAFVDDNWREKWGDKIINRFAKIYIATSPRVYRQIVELEKVNSAKVRLINYGYNFNNFKKVNPKKVDEIKKKFPSEILLVQAARYISEKRHYELINSVKQLVELGYDIKLLLLGKGPLEQEIDSQIVISGLQKHVFNIGFQLNIMDYFAAADLVVHFSISEASNSAIKEAAWVGTSAAVCTGVGDFDEYIKHGINGMLLNKENPGKDFIDCIKNVLEKKYSLSEMGRQLMIDVVSRFDIKNVIDHYKKLNKEITDEVSE